MRYTILAMTLMIFSVLTAQKSKDSEYKASLKEGTHFEFDKEFIDLGEVRKGEKRSFSYTMKNTGTEDIEINYVSYCECTTVDYPEYETLKPGETMVFDAIFDSATKDEEETIEIEVELKNIDPKTNLPFYFTLDYHFTIAK